jgi:hypothetical protein
MKRIVGVHPDWGITVVRLMTGLLFAIHGYQKFAGGIGGVAAFFTKAAIPFPGLMAPFIAILELVGGILLGDACDDLVGQDSGTGLERERPGSDVARRLRPLRPCGPRGCGARPFLVGT